MIRYESLVAARICRECYSDRLEGTTCLPPLVRVAITSAKRTRGSCENRMRCLMGYVVEWIEAPSFRPLSASLGRLTGEVAASFLR